jgi:16S rRNA processing protein RimM
MSTVLLGMITGAHGIKGEVKVKSFTDDPKAIADYGPLRTGDGRVIEIMRLKPAKDHLIALLKGVADRNSAEALRGVELHGLREEMGGQVLLSDLVGRQVTANSSVLGRISGFQNFGAGELMELDTGLLIPARFIASSQVDVEVDLPDGFVDPAEKD